MWIDGVNACANNAPQVYIPALNVALHETNVSQAMPTVSMPGLPVAVIADPASKQVYSGLTTLVALLASMSLPLFR